MRIRVIRYHADFAIQFCALPRHIQKKALRVEKIFRENPFHPSLRMHKLRGKLCDFWSLSLNRKYRIIFKPLQDGTVLLVSVGVHAIYDDF